LIKHPAVLLSKGIEKGIEKVLFERDLLLLAGKLPLGCLNFHVFRDRGLF